MTVCATTGTSPAQQPAAKPQPPDAVARYKAESLFATGLNNLRDRQFAEAETAFRRSFEFVPEIQNLMGLAEVYMAQGKRDDAVRVIQTERDRQPDNAELRVILGDIEVQLGKRELAVAEFQKAIDQLEAQHAVDFYVPRGYIIGDTATADPVAEALKVLTRADDLPKGAAGIHVRLAEIQLQRGDLEASLAAFAKAQELLPKNGQIATGLAILMAQSNHPQAAIGLYRAALKITPNNPIVLNNLAYILAEGSEGLDEALRCALRARELVPQSPELADTLGFVYLQRKMPAEAMAPFAEALRRQPSNADYKAHLLLAIVQRGDRSSAAAESLRSVLQPGASGPTDEQLKNFLSAIAK